MTQWTKRVVCDLFHYPSVTNPLKQNTPESKLSQGTENSLWNRVCSRNVLTYTHKCSRCTVPTFTPPKHIASLTARGGGRSVWNEEASNFSIINFQVDVIFQRMEVEAIELPWPSSLRVRRSCCRASPPGLPQSFPVCWAQTVEVRCLCPSSPPSSSLLLALLSRLSLPYILQVNNMMGDIFLVFPLNLPSAK